MKRSRIFAVLLLLAAVTAPTIGYADEAAVKVARDAFLRGAKHVRDAQWADALAAFEESAKSRSHALTSFNVGACHRAMGLYTLARRDFERALAENAKSGDKELTPALADECRRALDEMKNLQSSLDLTLQPENVQIAIDGRPLETQAESEGTSVWLAGTLPPGPGAAAPRGPFRVLFDPGVHVITVSRRGFADAVVRETLGPGARKALRIELDKLPASMRVASAPEGGQVLIDDVDVGLAPLTVSRPAGRYHVVVKKKGFVNFETQTAVDPGQNVDVTAKLSEVKPGITSKWWFWTGAAAVLAGAAATTYFLTRPDPERPPVDGGGLNWAAKAP